MQSLYFNHDIPDVVLKSFFKKYDADNSGFLDKKELSSLLKDDLGLTTAQTEVYIHLLDEDGDAKISSDEFCTWLRSNERFSLVDNSSRYYRVSKAVELFKKYDRDGSQSISCNEFTNLLTELGYKMSILTQHSKPLMLTEMEQYRFWSSLSGSIGSR
ncbi:calbindin-like [Dreissena polymorpha]|uniref:EF-hand domain-containing protein n=1 Tax=Dreissena polymorpha TaxID=45954 RepID=A0A9D4E2Y2_DREPO|nr:calbindin-like [Dreissena polymorpha]KAH3771475.1 hypothetical protein DPMN_172794 [Dreissena polymorpha]